MPTSIFLGKKRPLKKIPTVFFVFASEKKGAEVLYESESLTSARQWQEAHAPKGTVRVGHRNRDTGEPVCL